MTAPIRFDNSYVRLPASFYARVSPRPAPAPRLVALNRVLAADLGLDPDRLASTEGIDILSGRRVPEGADPIAAAYAGHQFGNFVPQLGDGRAILLGEVVGQDGQRRDIQLKGSGETPFSRRGDGRAALGPVLREYLVSEAMAALGIPTTRALAAVATGDTIWRETELPGAVLTRVAASHIRVGTFQFFAARGDTDAVRNLVDHVVARHYPEVADAPNPAFAFFESLLGRQARLVARWLMVGFVHGVMNTDNMSVAGETIDYGPCAFLDAYDPATVFSSIDQNGRYAYANQPAIAQWNLTRLAECLLPLFDPDKDKAIEMAQTALAEFVSAFNAAYLEGLRGKLGLAGEQEGDLALAQDLLGRMAAGSADFTQTFRWLCDASADATADAAIASLFSEPDTFLPWANRWRDRLTAGSTDREAVRAGMLRVNPSIIPRNHRVEEMIAAAVADGNYDPFERLHAALSNPFDDGPEQAAFAAPPPSGGQGYRTFCGT